MAWPRHALALVAMLLICSCGEDATSTNVRGGDQDLLGSGGEDNTSQTCVDECLDFCDTINLCDDKNWITLEYIEKCKKNCKDEKTAPAMSQYLLACSRLETCELFLECTTRGGWYYEEQFEDEQDSYTEIETCEWPDGYETEDNDPNEMYWD